MGAVARDWERYAEYAGRWWTRKVRLGDEEYVLRSATSWRLGFLGSYTTGVLWLTTDRLIFTPSPFLGQLPMAWTRWAVEKRKALSIIKQKRWLGGWELRITVDGDRARFWPTPSGAARSPRRRWIWFWPAQREATEEWSEAINQWAKS
jgi:hypothetical protein